MYKVDRELNLRFFCAFEHLSYLDTLDNVQVVASSEMRRAIIGARISLSRNRTASPEVGFSRPYENRPRPENFTKSYFILCISYYIHFLLVHNLIKNFLKYNSLCNIRRICSASLDTSVSPNCMALVWIFSSYF